MFNCIFLHFQFSFFVPVPVEPSDAPASTCPCQRISCILISADSRRTSFSAAWLASIFPGIFERLQSGFGAHSFLAPEPIMALPLRELVSIPGGEQITLQVAYTEAPEEGPFTLDAIVPYWTCQPRAGHERTDFSPSHGVK